jgi:hypothetical protein
MHENFTITYGCTLKWEMLKMGKVCNKKSEWREWGWRFKTNTVKSHFNVTILGKYCI